MKPDQTLKAPRHLRSATRAWWLSVTGTYQLEPHHIHLLTLAAESLDRLAEARALIKRDGLVTTTARGGVRTHPAVRIESDNRIAFARLIRELDLDIVPSAETPRLPSLRSVAR